MELTIPGLVQLGWCEKHAGKLGWCGEELGGRVLIRASEPITYVDPMALAMLAAWAKRLHDSSVALILDDSLKTPYSWRCGLLSALAGRFEQAEQASALYLRKHVRLERDIERALADIRLVCQNGGRHPGMTDGLVYFLSEMLRNVFEHSDSPEGAFVCGGHFPKAGRTSVAIVDLGVTVPRHVQRRWKEKVAKEIALRVALEPRTSGSSDERRNAGLGLYMTRRIATLMGGSFLLVSDGLVAEERANLDAGPAEVDVRMTVGAWPGTAVAVSLSHKSTTSFEEGQQVVHDELAGRPAMDVFRAMAEPGQCCIDVPPDVRSIAQDKLLAAGIRENRIIPEILRGDAPIVLDFSGISLTTQSYVHALLAEPVRHLGTGGVAKRLRVVGAQKQVKQVIKIVLQYVLN